MRIKVSCLSVCSLYALPTAIFLFLFSESGVALWALWAGPRSYQRLFIRDPITSTIEYGVQSTGQDRTNTVLLGVSFGAGKRLRQARGTVAVGSLL